MPLLQISGEVEILVMQIGDREMSSSLTIVGVLPSDAGSYTCTAENEVAMGGVITSTAVLMVYGKLGYIVLLLGIILFVPYSHSNGHQCVS